MTDARRDSAPLHLRLARDEAKARLDRLRTEQARVKCHLMEAEVATNEALFDYLATERAIERAAENGRRP